MQTAHPLCNDDILRQILHRDLLGLPDLASSAQVCKAFSEPALDALWRRIYFQHLLKILVPNLQLARYQHHRCQWEPSTGQWERFHSYARRGRDVVITENDLSGVFPDVVSAIIQYSRKDPLFPHMPSLCWIYSDKLAWADLVVDLVIQAAGSLRGVELTGPGPGRNHFLISDPAAFPCFQLLLQTLAREAPSLQYLKLFPATSSVLSLLAPFRHLRTLLVFSVNISDVLRICAPMPCLAELSVGLADNNVEDPPRCVGFPALRKLTLRGDLGHCYAMDIAGLCRSISSPDMTSIVFEALVTNTWDKVHDLLDTIQSSSGTSLRVLELNCYVSCIPSTPFLAIDAMAPLLRLHQLEHVELSIESESRTDLTFTDDVLCAMATAWPNLTHLALSSHMPSALSLYTALTSFAQGCPALRYLHLHISLHDRPAPGDVGVETDAEAEAEGVRPSCAPHMLTKLYWETLRVNDAPRLARFLDGTFPQVDLGWMSQEESLYSELWSALVEVRAGRERHAQHVVVS